MSFSRFAATRSLVSALTQRSSARALTSTISATNLTSSVARLTPSLLTRSLGTTTQLLSSNADKELANFLTEEIQAEKKNTRAAPSIDGFKVESDGAEVKLIKEANGEKIVVQLNVNHTVDSAVPDDGSEEAPEMKSKPDFEVDIVKAGGQTLSFTCSYIADISEEPQQGEEITDVFSIDEVTMFEGENWSEKKYAVAGDILDGYLYDLFMSMLEERGINAAFAEKLSDFCSSHEHTLYIQMLENLQSFAKK